MSVERLPLFPLSAHLLPGGRIALKIFEPRYIRMVKEVTANNSGFVMCMVNAQGDENANEHIYSIGTFARIIDFELLSEGLLGIKVAGVSGVKVRNIETEFDKLRFGECETLTFCDFDVSPEQISPMVERLKELFTCYPEVSNLYDKPEFDNACWVLNRWLELLPLDAEQKQEFLAQQDGYELLDYMRSLVR